MTSITLTSEAWDDLISEGKTGRVYVKHVEELTDEDGTLVTQKVHRRPIEPDADVTAEPKRIRDFVKLARTPEALARFEALREAEPVPEPVVREARR